MARTTHNSVQNPQTPLDPNIMEMYKIAVSGVEKTSERRGATNNIYMTLHGVIFAYLGSADKIGKWSCLIALFGLVVSMSWFMQLRGYKLLNKAKFSIIDDIESKLPVKLFFDEWEVMKKLRENSWLFKGHSSLSYYEMYVPVVFGISYLGIAVLMPFGPKIGAWLQTFN